MIEAIEAIVDRMRRSFFGKYRGTVIDNADDENRGRLLVEVPAVMGSAHVWAMPCVAYAGDNVGLRMTPPSGAGVWVEFEGGDPDYPIWTGCFWHEGQMPEGDRDPKVFFWRTDQASIRIDAAEGSIELEVKDGATLKLSSTKMGGESAQILMESGGRSYELTATGLNVHDGAFEVV